MNNPLLPLTSKQDGWRLSCCVCDAWCWPWQEVGLAPETVVCRDCAGDFALAHKKEFVEYAGKRNHPTDTRLA